MDDKTIDIVEFFERLGMTPQEQAEAYHEFLREHGLTGQFLAEIQQAEDKGVLN